MAEAARVFPALDLLLLYGSRARGDGSSASDWDFGYLGGTALDVPGLTATLARTVGSDRLDVVDLRRASGLLRYRAARDGRIIFEAEPGVGRRFQLDAVRFWCDAAPVLQRGYAAILAGLER